MPLPLLGFVVAQLGLRAIPVLLRSGQYAMRYLITEPGTKGTALRELGKRVLGKNAVVDDLAKLTSKKADNVVSKIIDPKKLTASERTTLMNTTYKDSSKLLQSQKSYPSNAKLASDIEKGFGQSFSKESSGRLFIAGDRTTVATKEVLKKTADAPKALPKPGTPITAVKRPGLIEAEKLAAEKAAIETAKGRITVGTSIQKGTQARKDILPLGKEAKKQIVKFKRGTEKLQKAAKGTETGEVIAEGLRGVGSTPKPPWWQATIPPFLRTGKGVWNPYKGAYPPQVSPLRVGGTGVGIGLLSYNFPRAGDILEAQKSKEEILSPEDILKTEMDKWAAAFNPEAITEDVDISLPERIE